VAAFVAAGLVSDFEDRTAGNCGQNWRVFGIDTPLREEVVVAFYTKGALSPRRALVKNAAHLELCQADPALVAHTSAIEEDLRRLQDVHESRHGRDRLIPRLTQGLPPDPDPNCPAYATLRTLHNRLVEVAGRARSYAKSEDIPEIEANLNQLARDVAAALPEACHGSICLLGIGQ
jgi:hypothetical protein